MTRFSRLTAPAVIALTAGFALTACAATIDEGSVEKEVKRLYKENAGGDTLKDVSCPKNEDAKKGNKFKCDITTADGKKGQVTVTLTNNDGKFTLELTKVPK
ncbi:MAG: DUF4333 domain-containing protein [Marmoricola sp.]